MFIVNWLRNLMQRIGGRSVLPRTPAPGRPVGWSSMAALLEDLEKLGNEHQELYDTDVRESLWSVIEEGLIQQTNDFKVPQDLGMFSPEANTALAKIMMENIKRLREVFAIFDLHTEEKRRASFFNPELHTESGRSVEDFFGSP